MKSRLLGIEFNKYVISKSYFKDKRSLLLTVSIVLINQQWAFLSRYQSEQYDCYSREDELKSISLDMRHT